MLNKDLEVEDLYKDVEGFPGHQVSVRYVGEVSRLRFKK
jgi:hypothetical protein